MEGVEVDAEGEGEEALGDALDQAADGFGEVVFEAHLALGLATASRVCLNSAPQKPLSVNRIVPGWAEASSKQGSYSRSLAGAMV